MHRFYRFLIAAFAVITMFSCAHEIVETPKDECLVHTVLSADLDSDTKAHLGTSTGGSVPVLWDDDDAIAVYDGTAVRRFTIVPGSNTGSSARFEGDMSASATSIKAAYPYSAAKLSGTDFDVDIPAVQTPGSSELITGATMAMATAAVGEAMHFHNAVALLRFTVGAGVSRVLLHTADGENIASGPSHSVQMNLTGNAGTYVVAVRPGSYNGIKAFVTTDSGSTVKESSNTLTVQASQICNLGVVSSTTEACVISTLSELKSFLSASQLTARAYLVADISGASALQPASSFAGEFYGLGHTISGISASDPMFTASSGSISDLVLSGYASSPSNTYAPLVGENSGTVSNVTSNVVVSRTTSSAMTESILMAGIVAKNSGTVKGCTNASSISFRSTASVTGVGVAGIAAYSTGAIEDCSNSGELTINAAYTSGLSTVGTITAAVPSIGGIMAFGQAGSSITNCINRGKISHTVNDIASTPSLSFRSQFGGIAGSPAGPIKDCHNYGDIEVSACTADGAAFSTYNYILGVAGISGGEYLSVDRNATEISGCVNDGKITVRCDASKSNTTVGGIVAWPGVESTAQTVKTGNCVNNGDIKISGTGKYRVGGIQGGSGNMVECSNTAAIVNEGSNTDSAIGGLCGFHSQNHAISSCSNTGDISSSCDCMVGGLVGNHGNAASSGMEGSKVSCKVTTSGDGTKAGMIIGKYSGTTAAIVSGTEANPVDVSGNIVLAGVEVLVHKNNYTKYLCGTVNTSANHTIHAVCNVEGPESQYYAEGHVKYSDGTAAQGITVSDGFNVAVTDASGYYHLETCADTWYIYFSYPSDAVITKNANGLPDFFQRYDADNHTYDFSFEKQSVENEFALFALADPQAHYAARGTQKKADTSRFLEESVPGFNSEIASMDIPCYGVTLGDIVYSESSRNSNPGMTIMRTDFAKVNMPVFQLMGNHDYTYFYTTSELKTDSQSSTLFLKVQRKFEDTFGPVNYSFNRGKVHVVCMRNIIWDSTTDASEYHGGFTNEQYNWLKADMANVPSDMMVILCVHIPLVSLSSRENVLNVLNLIKSHPNSTVFSGHTHYKRGVSSTCSSGLYEHVHSAVCGTWWWSRIEGDGCPNGYTVYKIDGTSVEDEYFIGVNEGMNERSSCQMRIYRGGMTYGGSYAYFNASAVTSSNQILINLFNGDNRWKSIKVYEDGVYSGNATLITAKTSNFASVSKGSVNAVPSTSSQDWWAIGYHIGVVGRGTSSTSYYTTCYHMYKYTLKDSSASIKVEATDAYGNVYTCTDVVESGTSYPYEIVGIR